MASVLASSDVSSIPPQAFAWFDKKNAMSISEMLEMVMPQTRPTFQFVHAVSGIPKNRMANIDASSQYSSVQIGEDAYFSRCDSMGVADGVGGWSHSQLKGANPALYSRKIMHYACQQLQAFDDVANDYDINDYYDVDPIRVLSDAYDLTCRDATAEGLVGSTTAMIVILRDDELRIANLGDCGLMIIRNNEAIFRSEEQQHSFNFPFQLGTGSKDLPRDAQKYAVKVLEGDIVIMGSDGIFDNVFDEEVLEIVKGIVQGGNPALSDPQKITDALLLRSRDVSEDTRTMDSPFQTRAIQEGLYYQGGKLDDVTILAGVIRLAEDSPDRR
ncbi:hypothetical protein HDU67_008481 [Dinochytrium kinnereticum]|nr:hypothetical protein HDU67_008481 [Dinochytrium kinnereticum]